MKRYVAQKGDRFYAVIYKGLDPVTGRERRRWHPAGTTGTTPSGSPPGLPPTSRAAPTRSGR